MSNEFYERDLRYVGGYIGSVDELYEEFKRRLKEELNEAVAGVPNEPEPGAVSEQ